MAAELDALADNELKIVVEKCNETLLARDKKRKEEGLAKARAIMAEVGLKFPEERGKPGRRRTS